MRKIVQKIECKPKKIAQLEKISTCDGVTRVTRISDPRPHYSTLARYSEDTDRKEEDRLAVLEYELRTAKEALAQARAEIASLTQVTD